jgi:hypothetical protein
MKCPRCSQHDLTIGHSCPDESMPCKVCGRSRVVVVVLADERGTLSECQPCIGCLGPNKQKGLSV